MKNKTIKDSAVTASSEYDQNTGPEKARLDMSEWIGGRWYAGWRAETNDDTQWLEVNLGKVMKITRIATQGGVYYYYNHGSSYYWVTSYSVSSRLHDQEDFHDYQNNTVRTETFSINCKLKQLLTVSQVKRERMLLIELNTPSSYFTKINSKEKIGDGVTIGVTR